MEEKDIKLDNAALELFKEVYQEEVRKPYFNHFIDEVTLRIKHLVCYRLLDEMPPLLNLKNLQDLLSYDFPRKDKAMFYKRMAEIHSNIGDDQSAIACLREGLRFNRKLSGVKKLMERIGYPEMCAP